MTKARTERTPVRTEAPTALREPSRTAKRTRNAASGVDKYKIAPEILAKIREDGFDLQWNVDSVLGQPTVQDRMAMESQGWEPVLPHMFGGVFIGMFTRREDRGEINVGGQVLMCRPYELTQQAQAEELQHARRARFVEERKLTQGTPDGVNLDMLNPNHGSAKAKTFLNKERIPSMPIQD